MRTKISIILIIGMFLYSITMRAQSWVSINSNSQEQEPIIELLNADAEHYRFKVTIPGFYNVQTNVSGIVYDSLSFEGYSTLNTIGEPALPVITQLIGLPSYGSECNITIEDSIWTDIEINKVYPYQTPLLETEEQVEFDISTSVYNSASFNSDLVCIGTTMLYKGVKNANLQICPFRYSPIANKLSVMKEFIINISFDGTDEEDAGVLLSGFENLIGTISNYNTALMDTYNTALVRSLRRTDYQCYDYLIIGADTTLLNSSILADFCCWKAFKGYKCKVVSTSTTGTTSESIKTYIQDECYKGLQYVLFVGDTDAIPVYHGSVSNKSVAGDYWYGCLDGDNDIQADIAVGRFSTNSLEELTNMINKTIAYESTPLNTGWQEKALMVAHREQAPKKYQGCLEDICTSTYVEPYTFIKAYGAKESKGGNNATNDDVIESINNGVGIVNYRGHGFETGWAASWSYDNVAFGKTQINALTNNVYPVVFSIACLNGKVETGECLLESFTRSPNGAVGVLGAFYASYTTPNHTYNRLLFETLCNDGVYNIGYLNNIAHIKNLVEYNNYFTAKVNAFIYLWGGDPSLEIWTGASQSFNDIGISMDDNGNINLDAGNVNNYIIRVVTEDGILKNEYTSTESSFSLTGLDSPCYIVIDKHNYIPYVLYCVPETSYIQNITITQDSYFCGDNVAIGRDVTSTTSSGNVIIDENSQVIVDATSKVTIKNGFICRKGSRFLLK